MTTKHFFFIVSEQMGFEGRTTSILIVKSAHLKLAQQEFFENFGQSALYYAEIYSQEEFLRMCATNLPAWVVENFSDADRLQPSEFSFKLQIHSRFG